MYRIVILPEARKDIFKASEWYENQSEGLGIKFQRKTIDCVDKLQSDFVEYGEVYKGLRRIFYERLSVPNIF